MPLLIIIGIGRRGDFLLIVHFFMHFWFKKIWRFLQFTPMTCLINFTLVRLFKISDTNYIFTDCYPTHENGGCWPQHHVWLMCILNVHPWLYLVRECTKFMWPGGGDGFTLSASEKSITPPKLTQKKVRPPLNRFEKKYNPP